MQRDSSFESSAIGRVHEGMRVVDATGEEIGKVKYVQMGDPEAVTTAGNERRATDLVGGAAEAVLPDQAEPDVPDPLRTRLLRTGYLKIGGRGLGDADRYLSSEHVRDVSGDVVQLNIRQSEIPTEH